MGYFRRKKVMDLRNSIDKWFLQQFLFYAKNGQK
jgi:hypothetical protein